MMDRQVKVCHVVHGIVGGGSEQVILNYCFRMPDIHFDLLYQYEPNLQILERFNEAHINCIRVPDKVHHPINYLLAMYRQFKKERYDIVHSHLDWYMNVSATFCAWLAGVPKRVAHHHQAYHPRNPLLKLLCAVLQIPNKMFATHWLACGKAAAINGWGRRAVEQGKVTILPNAIDPDRFKFDALARKQIREQYGISDNDSVVGHVGRFFPEKNHEFIINLFEELLKVRLHSKLLLVGNGPLQNKIQEMAKKKHLENSVIFAGLQKDTVPFYCAMDVLLLPSVREAFPMTLIEAQYNGLNCLVSDAVPKETFISNRIAGLPIDRVSSWVDYLKNENLKYNRTCIDISNSGFDIRETYQILERIYRN